MSHKEEQKLTRSLTVRFPDGMLEEFADIAKRAPMALSQQDIIRMALEIGLRDIRESNMDLASMIRAEVQAKRAAESAAAKHPKGKA